MYPEQTYLFRCYGRAECTGQNNQTNNQTQARARVSECQPPSAGGGGGGSLSDTSDKGRGVGAHGQCCMWEKKNLASYGDVHHFTFHSFRPGVSLSENRDKMMMVTTPPPLSLLKQVQKAFPESVERGSETFIARHFCRHDRGGNAVIYKVFFGSVRQRHLRMPKISNFFYQMSGRLLRRTPTSKKSA
jgi:hypothetical protein